MFKGNNKLMIWITAGLSLLAVSVAAISTLSWFQLDTQPITTDVVTSSPNLDVQNDEIYSYKVSQEVNPATGFIDYSTTTVQATKGSSINVNNGHQAGEDADFNVPSEGIGYYLVKRNASNTYTFTYFGDSYSWKLNKIEGATRYYNGEVTLAANDKIRVKNYDFDNHETVITDRALNTCSHGGTLTDNVVTVTSAGTYKVWLTYRSGSWDLSLEVKDYDVGSFNRPSAKISTTRKNAVTNGKYRINVFVDSDNWAQDNIKTIFNAYSSGNQQMQKDSDLSVDATYSNFNAVSDADGNPHRFQTAVFSNRTDLTKNDNTYFARSSSASDWWNGFNSGINLYTQFRTNYWDNTIKITGTWDNFSATKMGWYNKVCLHTGLNNSTTTYTLLKSDQNPSVSDQNTPSGYTFLGWYKEDTLVNAFDATLNSQFSDINLYAKYEKNGGADTTYNVKLFLNGNTDWGNTVYCYAYGGSGKYSNYDNVYIPANYTYSVARSQASYKNGNTGSTTYYYKYEFTISTSFPNVIFMKYDHFVANCDQTVDITNANNHDDDTYVILSGGGNDKWSGYWYASIAGVSTTMYDYYVFDQEEYLSENSGTPSVYAWKDNVNGDGTNTYLMPRNSANAVENAAWPGTALLTTDGAGNPLPAHVYRFRISSTYTSFILNNGKNNGAAGSFQTQDLNSLSGHRTSTSTPDSNTWYFVFSGKTSQGSYYEVNGSWQQNISVVNLRLSLCVYDGSSYRPLTNLSGNTADSVSVTNGYIELGNEFCVSTLTYYPSLISSISDIHGGDAYIFGDSTNGILYYFQLPNSLAWYEDQACTTPYNAPGRTGYSGALYARAYADLTSVKTFYIDASVWGASTLNIKDTDNSITWMTLSSTIAPYLYKVTLPNSSWDFQVNYSSYYVSGAVMMSTESTTNYLTLDNQSASSGHTWRSLSAINIGTATIQIYDNSLGDWVNKVTMSVGDIDHYNTSAFSNFFIYEQGLRLAAGTKFRIKYVADGSYSSYDLVTKDYDDVGDYFSNNIPKFLAQNGDLAIASGVFEGTARFNFYITNEQKLSVAMVPDYGNGFYIMKYVSSYGLNNFINGTKMNSSSSSSAIYTGYYISESTDLFIRSYIDGVDTLYTSFDNTSVASASMNGSGVVTINSAGYYNITVTSGVVKVAEYAGIAEAFKLNPLDTSNVASRSAILGQKTTLFIEVPFYCNNTYETTIKLSVSNPTYEFIGVGLYVTGTKLNTSNIYGTLTANAIYNNLTKFPNASARDIANLNTSLARVPSGQSQLYYAYIVIDYLPTSIANVSYANFNESAYLASKIGYFLIGEQYLAS